MRALKDFMKGVPVLGTPSFCLSEASSVVKKGGGCHGMAAALGREVETC